MLLAQATPVFDAVSQWTAVVLLLFTAALGGAIILAIFTGKIDISQLISEPSGEASMSRFQLLVFTFVIAMSFFLIVVGSRHFPDPIPQGVLILLGISSSSYLVSKGIQFSSEAGVTGGVPSIVITPQRVAVPVNGSPFTFAATTTNLGDGAVKWSLPPGSTALGTLNPDTGEYKPPGGVLPTCPFVEIHATSVAKPSVYDVAIVHLTAPQPATA